MYCRWCCSALWLVACGGASPPAETPAPVIGEAVSLQSCAAEEDDSYEPTLDIDSCLDGAARDIAALVERAGRSEALGRDHSDLFTPGAERIFSRAEEPSDHDVELDVPSTVARFAYLAESGGGIEDDPDAFQSGFRAIEVRREDDEAHVRATRILLYGSGEDSIILGLDATLVRLDAGWRIARLRDWPVQGRSPTSGRSTTRPSGPPATRRSRPRSRPSLATVARSRVAPSSERCFARCTCPRSSTRCSP